ncbi:hypothetical protein [uncultured Lacinutrix sp.]|uniref:DUF7793 family protein n=1 Tax=uncultured Lacinutrix sp. TaxID=574032 RepID=UPI002632F435|nr:hypothetical protein [uncultured Lacinutrix sp.]
MKTFNLPFGIINILKENIAEVIISEGVEFDKQNVAIYHDFLLSNLEKPFSILLNKKHSYSYTFEAQKIVASLKEMNCIAVVAYTEARKMAIETIININKPLNIKLFDYREDALSWIVSSNR